MKLVCVFFLLSGFVSLALGRIDHAKAKRGCEGRILFLTDYGEKRRLEILVFAKNYESNSHFDSALQRTLKSASDAKMASLWPLLMLKCTGTVVGL